VAGRFRDGITSKSRAWWWCKKLAELPNLMMASIPIGSEEGAKIASGAVCRLAL
jgi:hypothetical protein